MENVLEVKNIEKYYGNKSNLTKAIDNISFNVQKGEFVGIMGASGSRKRVAFRHPSAISGACETVRSDRTGIRSFRLVICFFTVFSGRECAAGRRRGGPTDRKERFCPVTDHSAPVCQPPPNAL